MSEQRDITIEVPVLARVEGEGALELRIQNGELEELKLRIYEPPRLFEQFLIGRDAQQVIDLVARICGICPVAYQMTAVQAIEQASGLRVSDWTQNMRRVFYCGEWLQSHALHIHLLAAPDFFGCDSVAGLAARDPEAVRRGLRLQTLGNDLIALFGGRSVHPVGVCPGGFFKAPAVEAVTALQERLVAARADASALLEWVSSWELPAYEQDFESVALVHPDEYAMNRGRIQSDRGLDIPVDEFPGHFEEHQVPHSTALHCLHQGQPYLVGPLARLNLGFDRLPSGIQAELAATGITFPSRNLFHSVVARAVEILLVMDEAIRLLADYRVPAAAHEPFYPRAGRASWATEAPRGLLWHDYAWDDAGQVTSCRIVPPTSQNQARMEEDLRLGLTAFGLEQADDLLRRHGETLIRNYDPCISCATHFLKLRVDR